MPVRNPSGEYRGFKGFPDLTDQESALAYAMLNEDSASVSNYTVDTGGTRRINALAEGSWPRLIEKFKRDPKECLAYGRANLVTMNFDKRLNHSDRQDRIRRYLNAFLALQIKLDRYAFPPDQEVKRGVPEYIPDGLTDMGSDDEVNPDLREREKIRVDKEKIFQQAKPLFEELFSKDWSGINLSEMKKYIAKRVAHFVYTEMPYDYENKDPFPRPGRSIKMSEVKDRRLALCRHHALETQVLLQAFGITGRLLKCDVDFQDGSGFGAHAANLVRVEGKWALLDTTNPDSDNGEGEIFIKPIPEENIDLNKNNYEWKLQRKKDKRTWTYKSRNNMYYKMTGN